MLTADDEDLDPSIEATLPVILRLLHAAAIDTNARFDAAAAELNEHDEDEEGDEDDGEPDLLAERVFMAVGGAQAGQRVAAGVPDAAQAGLALVGALSCFVHGESGPNACQ